MHLPPGNVVADRDRGGQGHGPLDLAPTEAEIENRRSDHGGVWDAHQFVARGLDAGHQQIAVLHHPHHPIDLHPIALAEGPGVDEHQATDHIRGHGAGAQSRQQAHEQARPLERPAAGTRDVGIGRHQTGQQHPGRHQPPGGPRPLPVEARKLKLATLDRPEPVEAGPHHQAGDQQDQQDGEQVGDRGHHAVEQTFQHSPDVATQPLGHHLGGRKEAQQRRDQQIAGQQQQAPVHHPQQAQQGGALLGAIQHLAARQFQSPQPGGGCGGNPVASTAHQQPLHLHPGQVAAQDQQGQSGAPQPGSEGVAAAVLTQRPPQLVAVALGQLLAGGVEGPGRPVIHGEQRCETTVRLQPQHRIGRILPNLQLLRCHRRVVRQLAQHHGAPLRHGLGGLGAGGGADLQDPAPLQGHPGGGWLGRGAAGHRCWGRSQPRGSRGWRA